MVKSMSVILMFLFPFLLTGCWGVNSSLAQSKLKRIDIVANPVTTKGSSALTLAKGNTQLFVATGHYTDGTFKDITNSVSWNSSDPNAATLTATGALTGVNAGTTTVTASQDGITSNTMNVTVTAAVITAIQITPAPVTVAKSQVQQLSATATYSDGSTGSVTNTAAWLSDNTNIAIVASGGAGGLLTGVDAGTTTVTASQNGITSNSVNITVNLWISVTGTGDFSVQEAPPRTWADADAYCNGLAYGGGGWRLPNKVELVALYNAYPLNQVHTVLGWETGERYWSSSPHETVVDSYYAVFLSNGDDSTFNNVNINFFPVTCIR